MSMTDPIADMLTRIRNANMRGSSEVAIPSSKIKKSIAEILKDEGFIEDWEVSSDEDSFPEIKLQLKYLNDGQRTKTNARTKRGKKVAVAKRGRDVNQKT